MKIIQISDTHISHRGGVTNENAARAVSFINELAPDFVVHSGDVAILDPDEDRDRVAAKRLLAGIEAPLRVLPGNHDVGEVGTRFTGNRPVSSDRLAAFRAHFGDDRFVEIVGDWAVIGLNSEIFESGLPEEDEQWAWIERLPEMVGDRPALLFTHKPVRAPRPELQRPAVSVGAEALPRLEELLARLDLRGYGSGHLHHYALIEREGAPVVSAPSTAFLARSSAGADLTGPGLVQLGVVEYVIDDGAVRPFFRAPVDLVENDLLQIDPLLSALAAMGVEAPAA
ncbi:metallophosphoesterase [Leucobacter sp. wl10]|uniref:metallophosphoesterase family protein n=1 Tax=Leucobacter sp. wl10 TaxID=2304677 RepID=UPI0013C30151|nr:metallophosphoesterase [Leucobacter sp. wl10]